MSLSRRLPLSARPLGRPAISAPGRGAAPSAARRPTLLAPALSAPMRSAHAYDPAPRAAALDSAAATHPLAEPAASAALQARADEIDAAFTAIEPAVRAVAARQFEDHFVSTAFDMLRERLGLTQEEFAAAYGIPVGTLRDWEQARKHPDTTAFAYLRVIARNPDMVLEALGGPGT